MIYVSSSATNLRPHAITGLTYGGGSDCAGCFAGSNVDDDDDWQSFT